MAAPYFLNKLMVFEKKILSCITKIRLHEKLYYTANQRYFKRCFSR